MFRSGPRVKNAHKTEIDGIKFPSRMEARRYIQLKKLQEEGVVTNIECQPEFILQRSFRKCCGAVWGTSELKNGRCPICDNKVEATRAIKYIADFRVTYSDGRQELEDVKGMETEIFIIKRKLFDYIYPQLTLKILKKI